MSPLKIHGPIRIRSMQTGITKWKEGSFEIVEKDNKISLVVHYNTGGIPRIFQLSHNIKNVVLRPSGAKQSRLMLTLQDNSFLSIDKVPSKDAEEMRLFLDAVHQNRLHAAMKSQGSGSFGALLGSRTSQKETGKQLSYSDNQASSKRGTLETKDDVPFRKVLGNPSRGSIKTPTGSGIPVPRTIPPLTSASTPLRSGLLENRTEKRKRILSGSELNEDYPKENDSSSNNKAMTDPSRKYLASSREKQLSLKQSEENRTSGLSPLQSSSFYSSRSGSKDYSSGSTNLDRSNVSSQTSSAKRSLGFLSLPAPLSVKKLRLNQDYTGWNKPRVPFSSHPQQQLQGFSNLGNTCYMNAILQSLFSLQSFANDLLKQGIPWKKIPLNALLRRFAHLLVKKDICNSETKKDLLKKVKNAISATAERFSGYMQNDAHEFLSQCLDQLKEDMEKLNKTWKTEPVPGEENSPDISATRVFTCPVITNLEFEVQHSIICKACGEIIPKREQFNDLSIDLPRRKKPLPPRSIQDSLDLFFRAEELEYSCEKCGGKCALVRHKFNRLPRVLILHLKRYSFNVALSLNNKIGQQVIIPRYLTLSSHCTENTKPPFTLGWSAHTAVSRPLKASQMVNSCITSPSTPSKKFTFKYKSLCLDSDSEDELKRSVAISQRLCELSSSEHYPEDLDRDSKLCRIEQDKSELENSGFEGMSEEELVAAVLEISKRESSPSLSHEDDDKPTSSPDTGFAEDDIQEMPENPEPVETEKAKAITEPDPTSFAEITKDCDENKENKTPEGSQGEVEWFPQYEMEHEREEQELQQALAQSLQEQTGNLPHSYRLISVVSHIGSTSSSGHYISDVYDIKKQAWFTYNDLEVSKIQEASVQSDRDRSGYIFFYMHKEIFDELLETEKNSQALNLEAGKTTRQAS
ncbi:PREDICTED: ubiquitin carboxyl-terminal hydrolase 37 [Elephantulus edwardii]|uniref:ubiquitin carboxyl-terminal hydrolase 37 n=1 Tax=Elephantulus edwardii TaxID=28737 RepID=UPI0003F06E02|nr:PREDICTED: ubiquitin carboxyl-terminal hydrolase 37 [Elephantulus edwardii]